MSQKAYCDYHVPQVGIGLSHAEIWHCPAVKKGGFRVDNATSYGFHCHMPRCGTRVVKVKFGVDNATSYGFHGHMPRCGTRVVKFEFRADNSTSYPPGDKRWPLTCQGSVSFEDTRRNC